MSFPKYEAYKDSGVEWLGEVPAHWLVAPLKRNSTCNDETLSDSTPDGYEIEYVEISDVDEIEGITGSTHYLFEAAQSRARRAVRDGDVLVSTVRTYLRAIAPVVNPPSNLIASTGFAVIRPLNNKGLQGKYLGYLLRAEGWIGEIISRSVGVSYPAINASDLVSINVPVPDIGEQTQIADFLDRETTRIDALIAEQQRLIELLKEKRQAVISHAVTKGIDRTAPMKDSGVEWLGEVPEHWEVKKVGYACEIHNNLRNPIDRDIRAQKSGQYPYYGPTGILDYIDEFNVEGEYFLLGEDGDHFLKFREKPMTYRVDGQFCVNNHAHLLRGKTNCHTDWAALYFETKDLFPWLIKQGVGRYKLRKETLVNIPITIPPKLEQIVILEFINLQKMRLNKTIRQSEESVKLLQERRSALISAAVTGKIDVRNWQPPSST